MQPRASQACSLLWRKQFVTGGEQCITPVTGSAYRKAWDLPRAICVCRWGRGGRKWVDLHPFDCISLSTRGRGEEGVCENTTNYIEKTVGCLLLLMGADWQAQLMHTFNPVWFAYCSVRHSCTWHRVFFTNASHTHERERERETAEPKQPCSHSHTQAQRLAITLTWMDFLCAWIALWAGKKTMFPLHGFILIFIGALHTESTNVSENGLDICSHSLLFLSLHPSFSLCLFLFLCSRSPDACCCRCRCRCRIERGKKEKKKRRWHRWWSEQEQDVGSHLGS